MNSLIIEEYDLREQYRFFIARLSLSSLMYLKKGNITHLCEPFLSKTHGHGHEGIISSGRTNGVQFVFDSLPSLIKITAYLIHGIFFCLFLCTFP